jgi:hypothetical protein
MLDMYLLNLFDCFWLVEFCEERKGQSCDNQDNHYILVIIVVPGRSVLQSPGCFFAKDCAESKTCSPPRASASLGSCEWHLRVWVFGRAAAWQRLAKRCDVGLKRTQRDSMNFNVFAEPSTVWADDILAATCRHWHALTAQFPLHTWICNDLYHES